MTASTIQRTNGAAWRGDTGWIVGKTGDGYRVRFGNFIAENVKTDEITKK
ncbi:hypothetical protein K1W54_27270 [Micromonospora sp. CPCC 205371]|nr:hypothetical protein [Micromonospora sp. CPCC 205371]